MSEPSTDSGARTSTEAQEASGLVSSLVVTYVEHKGGRVAVDELLRLSGLEGREEELRDVSRWFPDEVRVNLLESAAVVLEDPNAAERIGRAAVKANVGTPLKLSLRSLGRPRVLYANIGRISARLNRVHRMDLLEAGRTRARLRNRPLLGHPYNRVDCRINSGLLAAGAELFGLPPARVRHPRCIDRGDSECIFDVEWQARDRPLAIAAVGFFGLAILAITALVVPGLLPAAAVLAALIAIVIGGVALLERKQRQEITSAQINQQAEVTDLLMTSMQDLVSELQPGDVLAKITANARTAIGGAEFLLLVEEDGHLRCRSSSDLPGSTVAAIEDWAARSSLLEEPILIEDLRSVRSLPMIANSSGMALNSLCSAPLSFRDTQLGVLVALSHSSFVFLPRDTELLSSYAAQAAIALTNAKLFEAQQELAIRDPLTHLFNHRHFHELLSRELERCRRRGGELGLVTFDLNDFKRVNDTGGHARGDQVLCEVAGALESASRGSDFAFRIGGDEFALLLPDTGKAGSRTMAERVRAAAIAVEPGSGISYGVAAWPDDGLNKDELLAAADAALYQEKRQRRDRPAGEEATGEDLTALDRALEVLPAALSGGDPELAARARELATLAAEAVEGGPAAGRAEEAVSRSAGWRAAARKPSGAPTAPRSR